MTYDEMAGPVGKEAGFINIIELALFEAPVIVFGIGFLMLLPWGFVIYVSGRLHHAGPVYFSVSSAVTAFLAFCILAGISPGHGHPGFLDQFALAAETSGLAVFFSGSIGGLIY